MDAPLNPSLGEPSSPSVGMAAAFGPPAGASVQPVMRAGDVQAILRLVGGAAELWYTPALQRQFTLDSLCNLLQAKVGLCYTLGDVLTGGSTPCRDLAAVGLTDENRAAFDSFLETGQPSDPVLDVLTSASGRVVTMTDCRALDGDAWRTCEHYRKLREPLGIGPTLYAKIDASLIERVTIVALCREVGAPSFTDRDVYLTELCLSEMAWPFTADMTFSDPRIDALQPRLRKVMNLLLEGDSEKQVALKLKLSPHTVHEYVKNLYSELGVSSRGELLAQYVGKV